MLVKKLKMKQQQKSGFLSMLLDTLSASFSGNLFTGKVLMKDDKGKIKAVEGTKNTVRIFSNASSFN